MPRRRAKNYYGLFHGDAQRVPMVILKLSMARGKIIRPIPVKVQQVAVLLMMQLILSAGLRQKRIKS